MIVFLDDGCIERGVSGMEWLFDLWLRRSHWHKTGTMFRCDEKV
jgi:hypothetical protein